MQAGSLCEGHGVAALGAAAMPAALTLRLAMASCEQVLPMADTRVECKRLLAVRRRELLPTVVQRFLDALCPRKTEVGQSAAGD